MAAIETNNIINCFKLNLGFDVMKALSIHVMINAKNTADKFHNTNIKNVDKRSTQ